MKSITPRTSNFDAAIRSRRESRARWVGILLVVFAFSGCRSIGDISTNLDKEIARTQDMLGPIARQLQPTAKQLIPEEAARQLEAARTLYDGGNFPEAAKAYKKIADRSKGTATGEEAMFMLGESYFAQKRYSYAQDAYDGLLEDNLSTRYVDKVTDRMFVIAQTWLKVVAPSSSSNIQLASHEEGGDTLPPPAKRRDPTVVIPILPNFHDKTRPVFDTQGRALGALKSIWLNDPTNPRADDALMMTASYYLRREDYAEADRYYKILREEYPKSPHLENAFLLGSHVKLMSYQGSFYEGGTLDDALKLKESSLRLFPETEERQRLREELAAGYEAQAVRLWDRIQYYGRKNKPKSVAIYSQTLLANYPESQVASRARKVLAELPPEVTAGLPGFDTPPPPTSSNE